MESSNKSLIVSRNSILIKSGYKKVHSCMTGANSLFIKLLPNDYYLSLGIFNSKLYSSKFSASYYVSTCSRWGSFWDDIPKESYERVSNFLGDNERRLYLSDDQNTDGNTDGWWENTVLEINNFLIVIKITEIRFLEQEDLFLKLQKSKVIKEFSQLFENVIEIISNNNLQNFCYNFIPSKIYCGIPQLIFQAAELSIKNNKGILNKNTVKILAADSWNQIQVNPKFKQLKANFQKKATW